MPTMTMLGTTQETTMPIVGQHHDTAEHEPDLDHGVGAVLDGHPTGPAETREHAILEVEDGPADRACDHQQHPDGRRQLLDGAPGRSRDRPAAEHQRWR